MGDCPNKGCQAKKIEFRVREVPVRDPKAINIIRWAPQQIDVVYNHITGISRYFYSIPAKYKRAVGAGDLEIIAGLPLEYLDAIKREMAVELDSDNVFHMKKMGLAEDDQGWGRPDIQPALKTCFRTQIFAKANEAIALSRINPWSIVSPEGTRDINIQTDVDAGGWRSFMEGEFKKHRDDGNRVTFSEIGIKQTDAFGNAKELMMTAEYKAAQEEIVIAIGYPIEWIYGGLCTGPNSLISTPHGIFKIGDMAPDSEGTFVGVDLQAAGPHGLAKIGYIHNTGDKRVWRTTTRHGVQTESSNFHRFRVLQSDLTQVWKQVDELQPGDFIGAMLGQDLWPESPVEFPVGNNSGLGVTAELARYPSHMDSDLARLLGYLVSEGSVRTRAIGLGNTDLELMRDAQQTVRRLFGVEAPITEYESQENVMVCGKLVKQTKPMFLMEFGVAVTRFLQQIGLSACKADTKEIPWSILQSTKEHVVEFLRGYFEGDGCACSGTSRDTVQATSKSRELMTQLQTVLLNLGIVSYVYSSEQRDIWDMQIRSSQLDRFMETVGFFSEKKNSAFKQRKPSHPRAQEHEIVPYLKDVLDRFCGEHFPTESDRANPSRCIWEAVTFDSTRKDFYVPEVAELLGRSVHLVYLRIKEGSLKASKETIPSKGLGEPPRTRYVIQADDLRRFCETHGVVRRAKLSRHQWRTGKVRPDELDTIRHLDPELASRVEAAQAHNLFWTQVTEVVDTGETTCMYDFTMDDEEPAYLANGLINHNSFSGSQLSIRSLELLFLRDREQSRRQVNFYIERIQKFLGRRVIKARLTDLKMADDMQTRELMARMVMAQQMAMGPFLTELGKDPEANKRSLQEEMTFQNNLLNERSLAQAKAQGEAQLIMTRYQNMAQKETAEAQRKFQIEQGIDMLTGILGVQKDQQAEAAEAAPTPAVHTGVSKSLSESAGRHGKQNAQAMATGQPPSIQQKVAEFILKDGGSQWVMGATAATLGALPPDARKRELERLRRKSPSMSVVVGDQLRRDNLAQQPNMRLDLTNRKVA